MSLFSFSSIDRTLVYFYIHTIKNILFVIFILVASANDIQRRNNDELKIEIRGPDASRVGKRRKRRMNNQNNEEDKMS